MPSTSYRSTFNGASGGPPAGHGHTKSFGGGATTFSPVSDGPAQQIPVSAGPGAGAFGSFGIGIGPTGGASAWRGGKRG